MKYSVMRGLGELNSIERRLPLYYQKLNELEKRKGELKALIAENERKEHPPQPKKPSQSSTPPAFRELFGRPAKGPVQRYWVLLGALALIVLAIRAVTGGSSRGLLRLTAAGQPREKFQG